MKKLKRQRGQRPTQKPNKSGKKRAIKRSENSRAKTLALLDSLPDLEHPCLAMPTYRLCPYALEINEEEKECDCDDIAYQNCLDDI
jgi:hypothetical protein